MKEENFNENDLVMDDLYKKDIIILSSPTEIIQSDTMSINKRKIFCRKYKKFFYFIIALFFIVLGIYLFILKKKGYNLMNEKNKVSQKYKTLDIKDEKLNKVKEKQKYEIKIKKKKRKKLKKMIKKNINKK